ncbi:hypothetical protein Gohar_011739 [Gossypium harknessii]|uniref:Uncharacterized protein n=1 Tax=Gossypium harknessii TaxID=34285 RepID=A0A7J9GUW1_9ROSI|nr:hypothetical protein [Gossypium harknessii]
MASDLRLRVASLFSMALYTILSLASGYTDRIPLETTGR